MRRVLARLVSVAPLSQSRYYQVPRLSRELADDYEARTWRERMHVDERGQVFVPPMALKNCVVNAARYLAVQIPGHGKTTYTKHFTAGLVVVSPMPIYDHDGAPILASEVQGVWYYVPSDGMRGGKKRVRKCFPEIPRWMGDAEFIILDDIITPDVFKHHLEQAGRFIGIGRFRPENNGYYGRFSVSECRMMEVT
ncbi:MAG TPA: hypothetical protein PL047_08615 [Methanothrix sp.]|nr:hypothetical protein [Methanothrix sp.]